MKQITEDYCSFETAQLLKEKGFDEPCHSFYEYKKKLYYDMYEYFPDGMKNSDHDKENNKGISAPTQSLALKWLREVHNLHITIKPYITEEGIMYLFEVYKLEAEKFTLIKTKTGFEKSELANEAALKYTLKNLI